MTVVDDAERRRIVRDSTAYLGSSLLAQAIGLLRSIALPVLLGPAQFGIWNLMNVVIGYGANAHLGMLHGLNKKVPLLRALDRARDLEELKDSVFWANLLLGAAAGAVLLAVSFLASPGYASALRIAALAVALQMVFLFYFCLLRAENRFDLVSRGNVWFAVSSSVLVVAFAYLFSDRLLWALIGLTAGYPLVVAYWAWRAGYTPSATLRWLPVRDAFGIGLPLIAIAFLDTALMSIDRWIVAWKFPETTLGHYALGAVIVNMLALVPISIAGVLFPKMVERFAATGEYRAVGGLLVTPVRAIAALMAFLIGAAAAGLPVVVRLLLPSYMPAVPLMDILVPGVFFLAIPPVAGNFVIAVDRQRALMVAVVAAMAASIALDLALVAAGFGVRGVALGTVCGYAVYGLGYLGIALRLARGRWGETLRFLVQLTLLFGAMVAALRLAAIFFPDAPELKAAVLSAAGRLLIVGGALLPATWLVNRNSDLFPTLRTEWSGWRASRGRTRTRGDE